MDGKKNGREEEGKGIVREYVFWVFQNPKTRLFTFFEVSCQKNVKNVKSVFQVFTFLHFEIANGHFHCKQLHTCHVIHTTLYYKKAIARDSRVCVCI